MRARVRFATLAQAIKRTQPAAPSSTNSIGVAPLVNSWRSETVAVLIPASLGYASGCCWIIRAEITDRSALQCSTLTPGFIRPNRLIMRLLRFEIMPGLDRYGHADVGMYTSFSFGYCGTGGNTPITVCTRSFIWNVLPTMPGSPRSCFFQYS